MYIIKRDGTQVNFDVTKIVDAIKAANKEVTENNRLSSDEILEISNNIEKIAKENKSTLNVEDIQNLVEDSIWDKKKFTLGRVYSQYRFLHALNRQKNSTDDTILSILDYKNENIKEENSNKNPRIASVQRDYMAGEVSKDIAERYLLPEDVWKAHKEGIIHFHDSDYFANRISNCVDENSWIYYQDKKEGKRFIPIKDLKNKYNYSITEKGITFVIPDECYIGSRNGRMVKLIALRARYVRETEDFLEISTEHNKLTLKVTEKHIIPVVSDEEEILVLAKELKIGMKMIMHEANYNDNPIDDYTSTIINIKKINNKKECIVYDFETEDHYFLANNYVVHNCGLVNLEDMFKNSTVISGTKIETPKSFSTACNIMTQIMAQVASSQYGGQSMTFSHIAPFVDVSRQKIKERLYKDFDTNEELFHLLPDDEKELFNTILKHELKDEIKKGVQTIQYQVLTLMTTNGQTPFITLFMYLNEVPEGQIRNDLALIIEEALKQRIKGVQNETGQWITPAFPKIIYVLDENNIYPDSEYFYLTKLAAQCTVKRMVPDYLSAKMMKKYKKGNVYTPMGCRSLLTAEDNIRNEDGSYKFYGRLTRPVKPTLNSVNVRKNGVCYLYK